jgi:hypothetical protein
MFQSTTACFALFAMLVAACVPGDPQPPECTVPDPEPSLCVAPTPFPAPGPDGTIRAEQRAKSAGEESITVPLQPYDAGQLLRVYPTTESDAWNDGGSITFLGESGDVLCAYEGLCAASFSEPRWGIPEGAASVVLGGLTTESVTARLLFTVVVAEDL